MQVFRITIIALLMITSSIQTLAYKLPDTGQTKCYNDTRRISCPKPGEDFYGQDSNYTINPLSFTKLDVNGNDLPDSAFNWAMVRDNNTGLIWEVKQASDGNIDYSNPHDADNNYTWYESNHKNNAVSSEKKNKSRNIEEFINAINTSSFGGYSDWRLPSRKELRSIIDYNHIHPSITTFYFNNTNGWGRFWSSTTYAGNNDIAWCIYFYNGSDILREKVSSIKVRAVRGKQYRTFDNFVLLNNKTIFDYSTSLFWQQKVAGPMSWKDALSYSENLSHSNFNDWRLPTIKELASIIDLHKFELCIDERIFKDTQAKTYWSSTAYAHLTNLKNCAWGVNFENGKVCDVLKTYPVYVRAVRGCQPGTFFHAKSYSVYDLKFSNSKYFAIKDNTIFTTKDLITFIPLNQLESNLNAIASTPIGLLAVGNNGLIVKISIKYNTTEIIPADTSLNLLDVSCENSECIAVGEQGTIIKHNLQTQETAFVDNQIKAPITAITKNKYAVTGTGNLILLHPMAIQSITDLELKGIVVHDNTVVIIAQSGKLFVNLDEAGFQQIEIPENNDEFIDIKYAFNRFIVATSNSLYTSKNGIDWKKDSTSFNDCQINALYSDQNSFIVLTNKGPLEITKFDNIDSGETKTAYLSGVSIRFENSSIRFENNEIKSFNIVPNDTMYIVEQGVNIGKIIFGDNTTLKAKSPNTSTIEQEYFELTGENKLYYNTGNHYVPVSSGEFWLKNHKVQEKPLFDQITDNALAVLNNKIDTFIQNNYSAQFDQASRQSQQMLLSPELMEQILKSMVSMPGFLISDLPVTTNELLLGDINQPLSPKNISSPFFRRLFLDTEKRSIVLDHSYLFGPCFIAEGIQRIVGLSSSDQSFVALPELNFHLEGSRLTGTIINFDMNLGPFNIHSDRASLETNISDTASDDLIIIHDANFSLKMSASDDSSTYLANGFMGTTVNRLKLVYNRQGFKLISGEAGAEFKIPNINIGSGWSLKDLTSTIGLVFREKDPNGPYIYADGYPDELDDMIVRITGIGMLERTSTFGNDFSVMAGLSLIFDQNSLKTNMQDQHNLLEARIMTRGWLDFPKQGFLTFNGFGGKYKYDKGGHSSWSFSAGFKLYDLKSWSLFEGQADITTDMEFSFMGISVSSLQTPLIQDFKFNWMGQGGGACLLFGRIHHNIDIECPTIPKCNNDGFFTLIPPDNQHIYNGCSMGAMSNISLMNGNDVYSTMGGTIVFEDIIRGAVGAKFYGIEGSEKRLELIADVEVKLPKIDSKFVPSHWREGKSLGRACLNIGNFTIKEEVEGWFSDESVELGEHFGLLARLELDDGLELFIPFSDLKDHNDESIFFICTSFNKEFTVENSKRSKLNIGDKIHHSFSVAPDKDLIIIDLNSSDNRLDLLLPDGTTITESSLDSESRKILRSDGKYTVVYLYHPKSGTYNLSFHHTGDEHATLFGSNSPPQSTITINGDVIEWTLTDKESDSINYRIVLVDDLEQPVLNLQSGHTTKESQGLNSQYKINTDAHIKTGNYRAAIYYTDNLNPQEYRISVQTIHLEKTIAAPEKLTALSTNDYVYLSWETTAGADGYTVLVQNNDHLIYTFKTRGNNITISDLIDGTYQAEITPFDDMGLSGEKKRIDFSVFHEVSNNIPQPVQDIFTSIQAEAAAITWYQTQDADFYKITLKYNQQKIYDDKIFTQPKIYIDKDYVGRLLTISIVAVNRFNNHSEIFTKQIKLFDETDHDHDLLPDMWEKVYFGSLYHNATDDYDKDGLSNSKEYACGLNPSDQDTDSDKINDKDDPNPLIYIDKNDNMIPDDWESYYQISDILFDNDNDGYPNYIEYLADLNPNKAESIVIDISRFQTMDYKPVINANLDDISIVSVNTPVTIDLSSSFDINGDSLTFSWKLNTTPIQSNASQITLDTSVIGMYRVEANVTDTENTVYRKFSIFVTDGTHQRIESNKDNIIELNRYRLEIPKASMKPNSYCVAGTISQNKIPIKIMGREIISHGLVYFYSDGYRMESPITITPNIKDDEIIDPYIFNYSTSIWTNINTGETFEPITRQRTIINADKSYTISTRETGLMIFARRSKEAMLNPISTLSLDNKVYYVDLEMIKLSLSLQKIDDITVSDTQIMQIYRGTVSGKDELRLELLKPGTLTMAFKGTDHLGNRGIKTYIIDVVLAKTEDFLINTLAILQTCSGINTWFDLTDYDFNQNQQIELADAIYLLQKLAIEQSSK